MAKPLMSKKKAHALSNGVFLICLAILFYTNLWWPGILLALWATIGLRQHLLGRRFDFIVTSIIFIGLFLVSVFKLEWNVLMPVLFLVGGLYLIVREYFFESDTNGEEKSEEILEDADINQQ